jgi:hypothetical protein
MTTPSSLITALVMGNDEVGTRPDLSKAPTMTYTMRLITHPRPLTTEIPSSRLL